MENLITNFQNPEFLGLFTMKITDAVMICTAALCSFFILICLQGEHNKITRKRIGLIYIGVLVIAVISLIDSSLEVYKGDIASNLVSEVNLACEIIIFYHPILIAFFYKKKRIRIGLKVFVLDYFLFSSCMLWLIGFRTLMQDAGAGYSDFNGLEKGLQSVADEWKVAYPITIILCILLIALMYFRLYRKGNYIKIRTIYLILSGLWFWIVMCIMFFFSFQTENEFLIGIRYCFMGSLLILSMLLPTLIVLSGARKQLKEKNKAQELYLESELAYIEQYKKSQEKTRAFRHDIKNNLSLLQYMAKEGKMEEVLNFLEELSGKMKEMSPQYITGDEMLDCIVAMKADKMSEMDIDFKMDGVLDGGLNMKPLEICTIFANVLDNAIEAAGKVEEADKRWISMTLKKSGQFWVINVENSTDGQSDIDKMQSGGYTSKEDKGHHGFGLFNIRQTVEKLDGILKLDAKEDAFSLTVMLPKAG